MTNSNTPDVVFLDADEAPEPEDVLEPGEVSVPPCISAGQYIKIERPKLAYLWDRAIPKPGIICIAGEPFSGKSHLMLQMAHAIAAGEDFGRRPTRPGTRVLYMMLESEMVWHELLEKGTHHGLAYPPNLFIPHPDYRARPKWVNIADRGGEARKWVKDMIDFAKPDLILMDPLRDLHSLNEQDSTEMKMVFDLLLGLMHEQAIVIVHHMNKFSAIFESPDPIQAVRGSSQITGKADAIWLFYGKDPQRKELLMVPRFGKREGYVLETSDEAEGFWSFTGAPLKPQDLPSRLVQEKTPQIGL